MPSRSPPVAICLLAALSGSLILLEGGLLFGGSAVTVLPGIAPLVGPSVGSASLDAAAGVLIILLAFALLYNPERTPVLAVGILALALLSLLAGGGFMAGAIVGALAGVGGVLSTPRPTSAGGEPVPEELSEEPFEDPVEEADLIDSGQLSAPPAEDLAPPADPEPAGAPGRGGP